MIKKVRGKPNLWLPNPERLFIKKKILNVSLSTPKITIWLSIHKERLVKKDLKDHWLCINTLTVTATSHSKILKIIIFVFFFFEKIENHKLRIGSINMVIKCKCKLCVSPSSLKSLLLISLRLVFFSKLCQTLSCSWTYFKTLSPSLLALSSQKPCLLLTSKCSSSTPYRSERMKKYVKMFSHWSSTSQAPSLVLFLNGRYDQTHNNNDEDDNNNNHH